MKYFKAYEFVPKTVYNVRGERSLQLIDNRLLNFIDNLREKLGKSITINNWKWGGKFHYRGLRTPTSSDYKQFSQHSYGRALDFDVEGMTAEEVRQWIIEHKDLDWVQCITFIEDGVSWVHVDCRYTDGKGSLWLWHVSTGDTQVYTR